MTKYENHCCGCATPGYPCLGAECPNRNVEVFYCDVCGEEIEGDVYDDGDELCESCLLERYRRKD